MSRTATTVPAFVLGGSGYVAGELLRLLAQHPRLHLAGVVSTSRPGDLVTEAFPHLAGTALDGLAFQSLEAATEQLERGRRAAVFAATPHGATASMLDKVLTTAEQTGAQVRAVDLSADFRFRESAQYQAIYGKAHEAPHRLGQFTCAIPEHFRGRPPMHATQPGCFTTAVTTAAYPFFALDLVEDEVFVAAITGSSGSGRNPTKGTHHPERRSTLHAYSPLAHRHEAEMRLLIGAARRGSEPRIDFVPHSGPFVRGIHATLRMTLREERPAAELVERIQAFYGPASFVHATLAPPRLTEVVGTNRCRMGVATRGRSLVLTSVIDNLVKGAAGGAVQWMNRLLDMPDDEGLRLPGLGWF